MLYKYTMNYNDLLLIVAKDYTCDICNYKTGNKNNFQKHLLTRKHQNTTKYYKKLQGEDSKEKYTCECGTYPYRASLYNHRKNVNKYWIKIIWMDYCIMMKILV